MKDKNYYLFTIIVLIVCIGIAVLAYTIKNKSPVDDTTKKGIQQKESSHIDVPIHFYLDGKTFVASPNMKRVIKVPENYHYIGKVKNTGNGFSGIDFEGNASGDVYLSDDHKTAYFQASTLEKANGQSVFVLCILNN